MEREILDWITSHQNTKPAFSFNSTPCRNGQQEQIQALELWDKSDNARHQESRHSLLNSSNVESFVHGGCGFGLNQEKGVPVLRLVFIRRDINRRVNYISELTLHFILRNFGLQSAYRASTTAFSGPSCWDDPFTGRDRVSSVSPRSLPRQVKLMVDACRKMIFRRSRILSIAIAAFCGQSTGRPDAVKGYALGARPKYRT